MLIAVDTAGGVLELSQPLVCVCEKEREGGREGRKEGENYSVCGVWCVCV